MEKLSPFWAPKAPFFSPFLIFLSEKITRKCSSEVPFRNLSSNGLAFAAEAFSMCPFGRKQSVVLEFLVRFLAPKAPFFRCKNDVEKQLQTSVYKIELREDEVCGERFLDVCI